MLRKALAAALALSLLAAAIYLFLPTWRAHRMLAAVSGLQVGKSTFTDAQKVASSLGAEPDSHCSAAECDWYRRTDNLSLPRFWIGEGASLSVGFRVRDGVVTERGIAYEIGASPALAAYADAEERFRWSGPPPEPVSIQTQWTAHVPRYSILVMMVPTVSPATRSKYEDFNFNCLWKYNGCSDAQQLLPTVEWKDE